VVEWFGVPCVLFEESSSSLGTVIASREVGWMYGEALVDDAGEGVAAGVAESLRYAILEVGWKGGNDITDRLQL
jgi:hypothetical protein